VGADLGRSAIYLYSLGQPLARTDYYKEINWSLLNDHARGLERWHYVTSLVFLGITYLYAENDLYNYTPNPDVNLYRGMKGLDPNDLREFKRIFNTRVGEGRFTRPFYWNAFISASLDETEAVNFTKLEAHEPEDKTRILFVITLHRDTVACTMWQISAYPEECEVLILPGTQYEITNIFNRPRRRGERGEITEIHLQAEPGNNLLEFLPPDRTIGRIRERNRELLRNQAPVQ